MNDSSINRMILWLTRGEVPLDGFTLADENLAPPIDKQRVDLEECEREAEEAGLIPRAPVRWGGFR
jgi:hypothetical protein